MRLWHIGLEEGGEEDKGGRRQRRRRPGMPLLPWFVRCLNELLNVPTLAGYYLSQRTQTRSFFYLVTFLHTSRCTLAGVYLTKLTLSFLGVNLVLESTYIGYHLTQVAPKSDLSFCKCFSFAFGSQPLHIYYIPSVTNSLVFLGPVEHTDTYWYFTFLYLTLLFFNDSMFNWS